MSNLTKTILRFLLFVFIQVYVLNTMPRLHELITPYYYFIFILWLPFTYSRALVLFLSFLIGITVDYFNMSQGLFAAAATLVGFIRPFIINLFAPKDATGFSSYKEPSIQSMGTSAFSIYILALSFIHNFYVLFLEWLSFGSFILFLMKVISTTLISVVLIFITELIYPRKQSYKTNKV